jgi:LCP family protein required for cell wall assembly
MAVVVDEGVETPPSREDPEPRRRRRRRAKTLTGAMVVTILGAVVPGAGLVWSRRWWGLLLTVAWLAGLGVGYWHFKDLHTVLDFVFDPLWLRFAASVAALVLLVWVVQVAATYAVVRPRPMRPLKRGIGATLTAVLCLVLVAPGAVGARYALVQADLVNHVFKDNATATAPTDVSVADPWGGRDRVSVLLLGGDGSVTREGVRTDSVILMSIDTHTGDTVMFSLPRNMMDAQFPPGTRLHELFPTGFMGSGDASFWMLNAVYGQVPALYPGVLGKSANEGADAVKQAVAGTLGIPVDYYALVNLDGFKQIVDAMGGVTVNINEPVAIQGDTDAGIPPVGYLQPGPHQRLNGFQALWFSRGRWGSDDYQRMLRQRCMVRAIIDEARPWNLLSRYRALAGASREIIRTDVPSRLLPAFVDLALKMKHANVRSIAFVSSDRFNPAAPDFAWLQSSVQRALTPPAVRHRGQPAQPTTPAPDPNDPGSAVEVSDSCAYHPVGG